MLIMKNKGYKYKLKPTKEQKIYLSKAFGCARKMYNIYVDMLYKQLESQHYVNGKIKYRTLEFPTPAVIKKNYKYMKEIDSLVFSNVQLNFIKAIKKYNTEYDCKSYKKRALKQVKTKGRVLTFRDIKGIPKFKSKKKKQDSFTTNNQKGTISIINDTFVKIPILKTPIKFIKYREMSSTAIIKNVTILRDCRGKYYISFTVEYYAEKKEVIPKSFVGLDYSQSSLYVSSDNEKTNYPHYYKISEQKLKEEYRKLSRKKYLSKRWYKQKSIISKLQLKISNQRRDYLHKKSFELANKYDMVCVEDINLRNMAQCLSLGKNLNDNGFGMLRNFLKYKLEDRGKIFKKVDKWYPSSKKCSACGNINKGLKLQDREWTCSKCGTKHDRDYNAAINICVEGIRMYNQEKTA